MTLFKIDGESNDGTDERTKLENGPEDAERLAFILLEGITHHNTSLGRPEQGGGDTKDRARKNQEPACTLGLMTSEKGRLEGESCCPNQSHTPRENRRRVHSPKFPRPVHSERARFVADVWTDQKQSKSRAEN